MKSIIIGGGKIGYYLLKTLRERNYDVVLVESNPALCRAVAEELNADILCGDGTDPDVLRDAGIEEADVVAAVTGRDEENLVICRIATDTFGISKTIARVNNPKNTAMFKALGVDKTVCSTAVIANLIEYEFDKETVKILQTFERGAMILVEITVEEDSLWCGCFVKDLDLPGECVFTSVLRGEQAIYPRGNTRILENDNILVLTNNAGLLELRKRLKERSKRGEKAKV